MNDFVTIQYRFYEYEKTDCRILSFGCGLNNIVVQNDVELLNVVSAEGKRLPVSRIHRISGQRRE